MSDEPQESDPYDDAEAEHMARESTILVQRISAILAGNTASVVGAALADLLAMWLAGHYPVELREELLEAHLISVRALIPINESIIWEGRQ